MYIIISGAGEIGYSIAESLSRVGHDITLIEKNPKVLDRAVSLDVQTMLGNGARMGVLERAHIDMADFYFALTDDDEANILGSVIAKSRGARTMALFNNLRYISEPISRKYESIGIDVAVCPSLLVVDKVKKIISIPALTNRTHIARGKMMVLEVKVQSYSPICDKTIMEIELQSGILIGTIFRGVRVIIPQGGTRVKEGDRLVIVLASPEKVSNVERMVGNVERSDKKKTGNVMVIGSGILATNLARTLEKICTGVTLVSENRERCRKVASILKRTVVINGDPTDKNMMLEEGLEEMDVVISLTSNEGLNVLVSLLAKAYNTPKVISLIKRSSMKPALETIGIDIPLSMKSLAVEALLREIGHLGILRTVPLHGGDVVVFETRIGKRSSLVDKYIKDVRLPKGILIVGILRDGKTSIPGGNFQLKWRDRALIFCYQEMQEEMDRYFRGKGLIL